MQQPGLAGARLRGPVGLPACEPVAAVVRSSARASGALPSRDRAPQHVVREPVDLEEEDPGHVRLGRGRRAARAWRRTTLRYQLSSSSIASSADSAEVAIVSAIVTTIAAAEAVDLGARDEVDAKRDEGALMHDRARGRA